jgi:hypothetical protein
MWVSKTWVMRHAARARGQGEHPVDVALRVDDEGGLARRCAR